MKTFVLASCIVFSIAGFAQPVAWNDAHKQRIDEALRNPFTRSFAAYQNGTIVHQYGDLHQTFLTFSVRKSLISLLYGIYEKKGMINLHATLAQLGINDKTSLTEMERQATVLDLLKARSGVYLPAAFETPGMQNNRPTRGQYKPGEHWFYNNWDFNALVTIFEQQTKRSVFQAFKESIADPIGMEDFDLRKQAYERDSVSRHPAALWTMSASDLLKLGVLLLNEGVHKGAEIIPKTWIEESTKVVSDNGIIGGYGYCWWVASGGNHFPFVTLPDGTYSARGTGEQILLVIPQRNVVIVHLTEVKGPDAPMMKVTAFGRLLKVVLE